MANKDMPNGFHPKGEALRCNKYVAGGTVYPGDCVKLDSAGKVVAASAGDALCGVARDYAVADGELGVFDHPDQLFSAQADDGSISAQTDVNRNYDILATSGDTAYKQSRMEIDASSKSDTATVVLKLLAVEPGVDNALGANVRCIVKINNHQLAGGTGTAGV